MKRKKMMALMAAMLLTAGSCMAQIFITDEDQDGRKTASKEEFNVMVAEQNVAYDQYVPVGSSLLVLTGLGAAYLLGKRRKDAK